jgi:protoheme IX farnesyltransferase
MSSAGPSTTRTITLAGRHAIAARISDYIELTKPKIAVMALVTVTVGYTLAAQGPWFSWSLLSAMAGIALMAVASSSLNQWMERGTDSLMNRTADRPIPSGRLHPTEVFWFGVGCGVLGTFILAAYVNMTTAWLGLITFALYTFLYTPLKRHTSLCTAIGAIPGALPPVLGWTAGGGELNASAFALFGILFLWQFPHFLAIAWLYKEDYSRAGLKMLPAKVQSGGTQKITGYLATAYAAALIPVSLLPSEVGLAGSRYMWAALFMGLGYLAVSIMFIRDESRRSARRILYYSLIYLPLLLIALTWDHLALLQ